MPNNFGAESLGRAGYAVLGPSAAAPARSIPAPVEVSPGIQGLEYTSSPALDSIRLYDLGDSILRTLTVNDNTIYLSGVPASVPPSDLATVAFTGSATDIGTGTLADARLSANVPLKNAANTFTGGNTFQATQVFEASICVGTGGTGPRIRNNGQLFRFNNNADTARAGIEVGDVTSSGAGVFTDSFTLNTSLLKAGLKVKSSTYAWFSMFEHDVNAAGTNLVNNYIGDSTYAGWKFQNLVGTTLTTKAEIKGDGSATFNGLTINGTTTFNGNINLASSSFIRRPDGNILLGWDSGGDYLAAGSNVGVARVLNIGANHTQIVFRTGGVSRGGWQGNGNFQVGTNADNGALLQVFGTSNITGAAQFGSTLSVTGAATFNGNLIPGANATYDIGTSISMRWNRVFSNTLRVGSNGLEIGQNNYSVTLPRAEIGDFLGVGVGVLSDRRINLTTPGTSGYGVCVIGSTGQVAAPYIYSTPGGIILSSINADGGATFTGVVYAGDLTITGKLQNTGYSTSESRLRLGSIEIQPYALNSSIIGDNLYYNGANWTRRQTGFASAVYFVSGEVQLRTHGTGTGTVTNNCQFKVTTTGAIGVGASIAPGPGDLTGANFTVTSTGTVTATGNITAGSGGDRPVELSAGQLSFKGDIGGWGLGTVFLGSSGTRLGMFGAYGTGNSLLYMFIGDESTPTASFYPDRRVVVSHQIASGKNGGVLGSRLLRPNYDGNADADFPSGVISERSTLGIGLAWGMYQENSTLWLSGWNYDSVARTALIVDPTGIRFLSTAATTSTPGAALPSQPTTKLSISTYGDLVAYGYLQPGGTSGPLLKNSSGTLQVRNSADSAFAGISAGFGSFSGVIYSDAGCRVSGASGLQFSSVTPTTTGDTPWWMYTGNSNTLYVRDMINARMHVTYVAGADSVAALTQFHSRLNIDGQVRLGNAVGNYSQMYIGKSGSHSTLLSNGDVDNNFVIQMLSTSTGSLFFDVGTGGIRVRPTGTGDEVFRVSNAGLVYASAGLSIPGSTLGIAWNGSTTDRLTLNTGPGGRFIIRLGGVDVVDIDRDSQLASSLKISAGNSTFAGHITSAFQSLSANPTTLDIPSGLSRLVKNTTSGEIRHWVNDGGVMKKSPAYT